MREGKNVVVEKNFLLSGEIVDVCDYDVVIFVETLDDFFLS